MPIQYRGLGFRGSGFRGLGVRGNILNLEAVSIQVPPGLSIYCLQVHGAL